MIVYSLDELIDLRRTGGKLPFDDVAEAMFLTEAIDCYLAGRCPFEGLLEAPEAVTTAYGRHADTIRETADDLRAAMRLALEEVLVYLIYPRPGEAML